MNRYILYVSDVEIGGLTDVGLSNLLLANIYVRHGVKTSVHLYAIYFFAQVERTFLMNVIHQLFAVRFLSLMRFFLSDIVYYIYN